MAVETPSPPPEEPNDWALFTGVVRYLSVAQIKSRYSWVAIIAQNRNAIVRLAIHTVTGNQVAIKSIEKSSALREPKRRLLLLREIRTLQVLRDCKHVTELYDVIDSGDRVWLVIDYASGGELFEYVHAKAPLQETIARDIFRPIVKVVAHMHSLGLVHRDLKFENILLGPTGAILLTDFGFSRVWDPDEGLVTSVCGTAQYSPPEVVSAIPYNPILSDSWTLGVMLYVMLFNQFPFSAKSIPELLQSIMKCVVSFPFEISERAKDLLQKLMAPNPSDRLTAQEVLEAPWINKRKVPKVKGNHLERVNRAALHSVNKLGFANAISEEEMDVDERICYRLYRRQYWFKLVEIPTQTLPHLRPQGQGSARSIVGKTGSLSLVKHSKQPIGSAGVNEELHKLLQISKCPYPGFNKPRTSESRVHGPRKRNIRVDQTMRFRTLIGNSELPIMNCDHTTLDPFDVVFKKLLHFLEREEGVSLISEHDFALCCEVSSPKETYLSITLGRLCRGFQLIGFSLQKIKGDTATFKAFEAKLTEYIGF